MRLAILAALSRGDLSPSRFARSRGEPVSNVSYHFRLLAEIGLIELARTRPVRGSIEHIYRLADLPKAQTVEPPPLIGGGEFDLAVADPLELVGHLIGWCGACDDADLDRRIA